MLYTSRGSGAGNIPEVAGGDIMEIDLSGQDPEDDGFADIDALPKQHDEMMATTGSSFFASAGVPAVFDPETPSKVRSMHIVGAMANDNSSPAKVTPLSQKRDRGAIETEAERLLAEETPSKKMKNLS